MWIQLYFCTQKAAVVHFYHSAEFEKCQVICRSLVAATAERLRDLGIGFGSFLKIVGFRIDLGCVK